MDEINSGILALHFKALNRNRLRTDLQWLQDREFITQSTDSAPYKFFLNEQAIQIAKDVIAVWSKLRSKETSNRN